MTVWIWAALRFSWYEWSPYFLFTFIAANGAGQQKNTSTPQLETQTNPATKLCSPIPSKTLENGMRSDQREEILMSIILFVLM
jgi:hypothetical protein